MIQVYNLLCLNWESKKQSENCCKESILSSAIISLAQLTKKHNYSFYFQKSRLSSTGEPLPLSRVISNAFNAANMEFSDANSSSVNAMFVQFAQYITHDITGAPGVNGKLTSKKYSSIWKTAVQMTLSNRCRHHSVELLVWGRLTLPPSPKDRTLTDNGLHSLGLFNDFEW